MSGFHHRIETSVHDMFMPPVPSGEESKAAGEAHAALTPPRRANPSDPFILECDGIRMAIPERLAAMVMFILRQTAKGRPVSVMPIDREVTPDQAAAMLQVPISFLLKLLDEGTLGQRKIGTHRRIPYGEVFVYGKKMQIERRKGLDELTALGQEIDAVIDPEGGGGS